MTEASFLDDRGLLELSGEDRVAFLQGLVSNDVAKAAPDRALWAAFLTAQGKYLHDFFLIDGGQALLLECEGGRREDLFRRLRLYKLRSKIALADATDRWRSAALWGEDALARLGLPATAGAARAFAGGFVFADPRHPGLGARALLPREGAEAALAEAGFTLADRAGYEARRLALGLPEGSRDLPVEKAILLENGFDELGGVDWQKGCWMGQELTARTKYRALIKKRLLPVRLEGAAPSPGTPVLQAGREVGELRSVLDGRALALLRLEALDSAEPLLAGEARLTPERPDWLRLQAESPKS